MFRASDIYGRAASSMVGGGGALQQKGAQQKGAQSFQQPMPFPVGPVAPRTQTWNSATGEYEEDELPAEVQEMMGIKRQKVEAPQPKVVPPPTQPLVVPPPVMPTPVMPTPVMQPPVMQPPVVPPPVVPPPTQPLHWGGSPSFFEGPSAVGFGQPQFRDFMQQAPVASAPINTTAPSVEYRGFSKVDLNDRYYERSEVHLNGRPTYWGANGRFFVYWQGEVARWSICDAAILPAIGRGQLPGWAYKEDTGHFTQANGWMEHHDGTWEEPDLEVVFRMTTAHKHLWEDMFMNKGVTTIEFRGFSMAELNTRYYLRPNEIIQTKQSYWDVAGVYFIYWQMNMKRWAICDVKCMDVVQSGESPGWAYRSDSGHFANAPGWIETQNEEWVDAIAVESAVISTTSNGLRVEFSGFSKQELNTKYIEKPEEPLQGKSSFWDLFGIHFIYWQNAHKRWAICNEASLWLVKKGQAPGFAYKKDSEHFTKPGIWMESWGRDEVSWWPQPNATCSVLKGEVNDGEQAADQLAIIHQESVGEQGV